jgi:hypothetical protein
LIAINAPVSPERSSKGSWLEPLARLEVFLFEPLARLEVFLFEPLARLEVFPLRGVGTPRSVSSSRRWHASK